MLQESQILKSHIALRGGQHIRILHVSDAHLTGADDRDCERKKELAKNRRDSFSRRLGTEYEQTYFDLLDWGRENCDVTVETGDVIDFTSEVLFEKLREALAVHGGPNIVYTPGSHEFSQYVGEAKEDLAYKMQNYTNVQNCAPNCLEFSARVIGGYDFVTVDDSYYGFSERQYLLLRREAERGIPIILCMHTPLYHPDILRLEQNGNPAAPGYMIAAPEEVTSAYEPRRREEQAADEMTLKTAEFIKTCPAIALILAGHLHAPYECRFEGGPVQLVTDLAGRGARVVTLGPAS
ncbi:MAG: metallophosphoesterase [Clostridia bacterium]|nr:metallophosphoesterase [Clostridia bacterium]